jgi:hypothetical protein
VVPALFVILLLGVWRNRWGWFKKRGVDMDRMGRPMNSETKLEAWVRADNGAYTIRSAQAHECTLLLILVPSDRTLNEPFSHMYHFRDLIMLLLVYIFQCILVIDEFGERRTAPWWLAWLWRESAESRNVHPLHFTAT